MSRIREILKHSKIIFSKRHLRFSQKMALFWAYIKISFTRFLVGRLPFVRGDEVRFLGYEIKTGKFSDFYWTFLEIFIDEDYYFEPDTDTPFILDCGANIGVASLYFKWLYPHSRLTVFEIEPENIKTLQYNISHNALTEITLIEKAVGATEGKVTLRGNRRAGSISKTLIDEQVKKDKDYSKFEYEVYVTKLSEYVQSVDAVDFLKMDIEGAESDVFTELDSAGVMNKIRKITLEFHRFSSDENTLSSIVRVFEKANFDIIFPNNFKKLSEINKAYYNYMICAGKRE